MKSWILPILFAVVVGFLLMRGCSQSNENADLKEREQLAITSRDSLKKELNQKTGLVENSKAAYVGTDENVKEFIAENDAELARIAKNNKAGIVVHTVIKHDTTVKIIRDTVPGSTTRTADIITKDYNAHIVSTPEQMRLQIMMSDTVTYTLNKENRLVSAHTNKLINVTEQNSFFIENRQKKKNGKWIGGGLIGAAVTAIILKSL